MELNIKNISISTKSMPLCLGLSLHRYLHKLLKADKGCNSIISTI